MNQRMRRLESRISWAVARARELGAELVAQQDWGVSYGKRTGWVSDNAAPQVCICGAIALAENPADGRGLLAAIAKKYDITIVQAASLSDGFEGFQLISGTKTRKDEHGWYPSRYKQDPTWYRIGRKWRSRADRVCN